MSWKSLLQILAVCFGFVVLLLCVQYVRRSDELPATRLELVITGQQDGREVQWTALIGRAGRVFVDGVELGGHEADPARRPQAALKELVARLRALEPPVRVAATNYDEEAPGGFANHPTFRWDRDAAAVAIELLGTKLSQYVAGERIERTVFPTVQDVLDLNLPEFTITRVDLPGLPYRKAYPNATDEPEVTIRSYRGHPMFEDPAKMPDDLRSFYPESLPPVAERLPENPAVLRGCDGIGRYSEQPTTSRTISTTRWGTRR